MICLQDPLQMSDKMLFLPPELYYVISRLDGCHSFLDIQADFMRRFGGFLFTEKIEELIAQLDEHLLLEGERFQKKLREREEEFKRAPIREAAFAGKSYEKEPDLLRMRLAGYFNEPEGPGRMVGKPKDSKNLKGVIAPHIDFQRGGFCYAFAHREIQEKDPPPYFVILGVSHAPMGLPFSLTRKDFATPLGTLKVNGELMDAVQSGCSDDLLGSENVHQWEHSIEFQCVFLRYLYPEPVPLTILPVLSGSLQEAVERSVSPMELPPVRQFIDALKEAISSHTNKICLIASADLSHVGRQFGDPDGVPDYELSVLEAKDRQMLGYVERLDAEGFFSFVSEERDRRRICGLSAIYTLLKVLEATEGRLLKYGQAYTPETQSVVSFASMAFYQRSNGVRSKEFGV